MKSHRIQNVHEWTVNFVLKNTAKNIVNLEADSRVENEIPYTALSDIGEVESVIENHSRLGTIDNRVM